MKLNDEDRWMIPAQDLVERLLRLDIVTRREVLEFLNVRFTHSLQPGRTHAKHSKVKS